MPKRKLTLRGKRNSWYGDLLDEWGVDPVDKDVPVAFKDWFKPWPESHSNDPQGPREIKWAEQAKLKGHIAVVEDARQPGSQVSVMGARIGVFTVKYVAATTNSFDLILDPDREYELI